MASVVVSSKGQVVLPKAVRAKLGISRGVRLTVEMRGDTVCLTPEDKGTATWRGWKGILKGQDALADHVKEHRLEVEAEDPARPAPRLRSSRRAR